MSYQIQSIDRCFLILNTLREQKKAASLNQLHKQTKLPRPTLFRFLQVLSDKGYVRQYEGAYEIGYKLFDLAPQSRYTNLLKSVGQPVVARLAYSTRTLSHLAVMDGTQIICLSRANFGPLKIDSEEGARFDAHATGLGKALLAYRPRRELTQLYGANPLRAHTDSTLRSLPGLVYELDGVLSTGLAFDRGELIPLIRCIAAPVFDRDGQVVCAVSVSSANFGNQTELESVTSATRAAAVDISTRLSQ